MKITLVISYTVASPEHDAYIRRSIEAILTGPVAFSAEPAIEVGQAEAWKILAARNEKVSVV